MKLSHLALTLFTACSSLTLNAALGSGLVLSKIQGVSPEELAELAQELLVPFKDGFQLEDIVTVASILESHFTKNLNMTSSDKRQALQEVLSQMIDKRNFRPSQKMFLDHFVPALAFVLFPGSIDEDLKLSKNPSPSEQEILTAVDNFVKKVDGRLDWGDFPPLLILLRKISVSYPSLEPKEKAYLAKRALGEIIDRTDTPYLPDAVFDEVFKRIGYPLIDYFVTKP